MNQLYKQLIDLLNTSYNDLTTSTLKVIDNLTNAGFDFDLTNDTFFKRLMKILSKLTHSSLSQVDIVFKLLCKIFMTKTPKMTHVEYEILFFSLKEYMNLSEEVLGPLELLNILISTKFVKPQVYDLIPSTMDILFDTTNESVQECCSNVISGFVKHFPIDKSLFLNLFTDLAKNIENEHPFVRKGLCQLAQNFMDSYGIDYYQEMSLVFVLQFATARVNEGNEEVKQGIELVIEKQIRAIIGEDNIDNPYASEEANNLLNTAVTLFSNDEYKISFSGTLILQSLININEKRTFTKLTKIGFSDTLLNKLNLLKTDVEEFSKLIEQRKEKTIEEDTVNEFVNGLQQKNDYLIGLLDILNSQLYFKESGVSLKLFIKSIEPLFSHPIPVINYKLISMLNNIILKEPHRFSGEKRSVGKSLIYYINLIKKKNFDLETQNYLEGFIAYIKLCNNDFPEYSDICFKALNKIAKLTTVS